MALDVSTAMRFGTWLVDKLPAVAAHLDAARDNILAFTAFPKAAWRQIWSNNPLSVSRPVPPRLAMAV